MTIQEINEKMSALAEYERLSDELEQEKEALKDDLKRYMIDNDLTVLNGLEHKATYTAVTSTRLDTKALKSAHSDLVKEYIITSVSNRFTFR
ncbi:hypothetical protein [Allobaculum stercoricanis]|uniref:hypothetical protein n=1 Tax=Allobaculum stercoricanis TaxID=174709 RepID=UPI0023F08EB2|nr:hypothetical protein [Allobaculum stercoricanis]